jgi:hypothetical protein
MRYEPRLRHDAQQVMPRERLLVITFDPQPKAHRHHYR